jgi:glucose/arabinose dehydrogenase
VTLALAAVFAACAARSAPAPAPVPASAASGVALVKVAEKLEQPLALTVAPGDSARRLFIAEKTGRIRVVKGGRLLDAPFLDLSARVSGGSEQGLLGLVFHTTYATTGRLFVNYTDKQGDTRIVEIAVAAPGVDAATIARERELLRVAQPYSNHNGGHLVLDPQGKLLIGLGDGGSGGDPRGYGQNPTALLGKMLRLDPDAPGETRPVIAARGLRNPWRYAIDRRAGDLYIADVGQNAWEEIDVLPLSDLDGANFGWNVMEGAHCFGRSGCKTEGLILPVVEYGHGDGCSITGGFVYRGEALPGLAGRYFYSDYCTAFLRSFRYDRSSRSAIEHWDWKKALDPRNRLSQVSSFGEDEAGEMYILSLSGTVWKLVPAAPVKGS